MFCLSQQRVNVFLPLHQLKSTGKEGKIKCNKIRESKFKRMQRLRTSGKKEFKHPILKSQCICSIEIFRVTQIPLETLGECLKEDLARNKMFLFFIRITGHMDLFVQMSRVQFYWDIFSSFSSLLSFANLSQVSPRELNSSKCGPLTAVFRVCVWCNVAAIEINSIWQFNWSQATCALFGHVEY